MAKQHGLGRGLDALFTNASLKDDVLEVRSNGIREVELSRIKPKTDQPRKKFEDDKIEQLAYSIKEHGILQPIVLVEQKDGTYQIVAGERRYRASKKAGLHSIPAVVRSVTELEQLEIALVENIQREDLDAIEQALSIKRLHEEFSQSYQQIAKRLGKAESTVVNLARLLALPAPFQQAIQDSTISEGHARALLALAKNEEAQATLFQKIVNEHWTVRKAELFAQVHKNGSQNKKIVHEKMATETVESQRLATKLKTDVKIQRTAKGGKITITFKSDDDLNRLLTTLNH